MNGFEITSSFRAAISIGRGKSHMAAALPVEFGQNGFVRIAHQQDGARKMGVVFGTPFVGFHH